MIAQRPTLERGRHLNRIATGGHSIPWGYLAKKRDSEFRPSRIHGQWEEYMAKPTHLALVRNTEQPADLIFNAIERHRRLSAM